MADYKSTDLICPTFIVSSSITNETLQKLNNAFPDDSEFPQEFKNFFNPVPRDLSRYLKPSRSTLDFQVEVTESDDPEDLNSRHEGVGRQVHKDGYDSSAMFVVLDDRSLVDDTVIMYYAEPDYDEELDDIVGETLRHWRVRFADAYEMTRIFDVCEFVSLDDYINEMEEEYTTKDGIFEFGIVLREHP